VLLHHLKIESIFL